MRTKTLALLVTLLISIATVETSYSHNCKDKILDELDEVIENKALYSKKIEAEIEAIKRDVDLAHDNDTKYQLYQELFDKYLHFQADSALHYVNVRNKLPLSNNDPQRHNLVLINRAEVMGLMGMYNEASHELQRVDFEQLDKATTGYYYRTYRAYYGWIADYTAVNSAKEKYLELADKYRDSVILFEPIEANRSMIEVEQLIQYKRLDRAIEILNINSELSNDPKQQAYTYYNFSLIYREKGDIDNAIHYLAKTAIMDLKMGTREYASLQQLAYIIYQQGDVNRAFNYLRCSMEDAVASNSRLRSMEVAKYYPIIDRAYRDKDAMRLSTIYIFLACISVFAIILIGLTIHLFVSRKRLSAMRTSLHNTNKSLTTLNNRLAETGRIKEVYIARYLERCVSYIDKLDLYRRSLKRLASSSKTDELLKALKSEQMLQRERKEFYIEFDRSFLTLFPNFVNDFNMLLHHEDHLKLKNEGQLNTELRIFALIRLGITDASQIAHFLGYSLATVYSYRSKMRHRALVDKDQFETMVMEL